MTPDEHEGAIGAGHAGSGRPESSAPGRSPIVFVSDASAEVSLIGDTLRGAGYVVADVPISMLSGRVAAQRPNVVLIDVDADDVLDELARLRKLPGSGSIDFVFIGGGDGIVKNAEDALSNDGSAFFLRPVDTGALVRKIEALTGGPVARRALSRRGAAARRQDPALRPSRRSGARGAWLVATGSALAGPARACRVDRRCHPAAHSRDRAARVRSAGASPRRAECVRCHSRTLSIASVAKEAASPTDPIMGCLQSATFRRRTSSCCIALVVARSPTSLRAPPTARSSR
jgi:CheY-like chemotaxis protein